MKLNRVSIAVSDLDAASAWYQDHLDMNEVARFGLDEYQLTGCLLAHPSDWQLELLSRVGAQRADTLSHPLDAAKAGGYNFVGYEVDDLEASYARLLNAGATSLMAPHPGPGGMTAYLADPEGNLLQLSAPYQPGQTPPPPPPRGK